MAGGEQPGNVELKAVTQLPVQRLRSDSQLSDSGSADMQSDTVMRVREEKSSSDDHRDDAGGNCGMFCCVPPWLQFFNKPRFFLVFICLFTLLQSMTINGLNGAVIPTIEKRFRLSSHRAGLIASAYDIASAIFVLPISYYGERAHKPRWLGIGCLLAGIGSLIFALPQILTGKYAVSNELQNEYCGAGLNHTLYAPSSCEKDSPSIYGILMLGQLLIGTGAVPIYTIGVAFLDEIADPKYVHVYIGLLYVGAAIGPAIGFLVASAFLTKYVDPGVQTDLADSDPNFVGNWWGGYVLTGILIILLSFPLLMYPRQLPNTAWIMEEKRRKQVGTGQSAETGHPEYGKNITDGHDTSTILGRLKRTAADLLVMGKLVLKLLLTPVLLTNTIGSASEAFAVAGLLPFITKYFESQFGVTPSRASLLTGVAIFLGIVGGIFFSSWLLKYRKVSGSGLAKYTCIIAVIATVFVTAFLVRCERQPIVGVTRPYPGNTSSSMGANRCKLNYTDSCVLSCGCLSQRYDPVCGADGFTYPTPCLAGCRGYLNSSSGKVDERTYTDCRCVAASLDSMGSTANATATNGTCDFSCSLLPLFVILLIGLMFFTFMNNVPAVEVVLQSVPADRRTLATGVQWVVIRCIASVPGPIVYGKMLDNGCQLWSLNCCGEGNCLEYSNSNMSISLFGATIGFKAVSFVAFLLSWRFFVDDDRKKAGGRRPSVSVVE